MVQDKRLSVDEGLAIIRAHVQRIGTESVEIRLAQGRVTAEPIVARRTVPSFRAAAIDGFALRSQDVTLASPDVPIRLPVKGRIAAGTWPAPLALGVAFGVATGAPVPEGADGVVMVEHAQVDEGEVLITSPVRAGLNVREIGEDAVEGIQIAPPGTIITADVVAAMAAFGLTQITVFRAPKLAVIVTGSELASSCDRLSNPAAIIDSNGPMIAAYAASIGVDVHLAGTVEDTAEALEAALQQALESDADIILTTGGASQGERDCVRSAIDRCGAEVLFHGLAMRPGKPILFALTADGRPLFGLPGNPVSAIIGMRFFVSQALRKMFGLPEETGIPAANSEPGRDGLTIFLRGRLGFSGDGRAHVDTALDQRSHILSSLIAADAWLRVDRDGGFSNHVAFPKVLSLLDRPMLPSSPS